MDGLVLSLPNARTYAATWLLQWLEDAAQRNVELRSLPGETFGTREEENLRNKIYS